MNDEQEAIALGVYLGRTPHKVEKRTMPHIRLSDGATIMPDGEVILLDGKEDNDKE